MFLGAGMLCEGVMALNTLHDFTLPLAVTRWQVLDMLVAL